MTRGAVVLVRFPFSDLSQAKLRPAVVLADAGRGDGVLVQVTSRPFADPAAVELTADSFARGSLERVSYARPGKLFTASASLVVREAGRLSAEATETLVEATETLVEAVVALLRSPARGD